MGKPITPNSILEFKGAFKKDPQRRRAGEPKPNTELGAPPKRWKGNDRKAWLEIVAQCTAGVLTGMDLAALEVVAGAFGWLWDNAEASVTDRKAVLMMLGKFGMTPSDRAGLAVPPKPKRGDFDEF